MKYFDAPVTAQEKNAELDLDSISFSSREEKWEKVSALFNKAYQGNASSSIAPYFKAFEAEALLNQQKHSQAIETLAQAVSEINDPAIKANYSLKLALMQLDDANESSHQKGFTHLKSLAENTKSLVHDAALFYLGSYFWHKQEFDVAKNYWNQLLLSYGPDSKNPSPWADQAKEKLKLISTK
jgi:tetratricopeptide (TPR) repeat protein